MTAIRDRLPEYVSTEVGLDQRACGATDFRTAEVPEYVRLSARCSGSGRRSTVADAHRAAQEDGHRAGVPGGRTVGVELLERDMILMDCMEPSSAGARAVGGASCAVLRALVRRVVLCYSVSSVLACLLDGNDLDCKPAREQASWPARSWQAWKQASCGGSKSVSLSVVGRLGGSACSFVAAAPPSVPGLSRVVNERGCQDG